MHSTHRGHPAIVFPNSFVEIGRLTNLAVHAWTRPLVNCLPEDDDDYAINSITAAAVVVLVRGRARVFRAIFGTHFGSKLGKLTILSRD